MNLFVLLLAATLSAWDYPARQFTHLQLQQQFIAAARAGDTAKMAQVCANGVKLLPDDATWQYNLACSLAYQKDPKPALDALEKAIDLGFRDVNAITVDNDLKRLAKEPRFGELLSYARAQAERPLFGGPNTLIPATGISGHPIALGEQNVYWDLETGCFNASLKLANEGDLPFNGVLYMNRDGGHSRLDVSTNYPGLTEISLDSVGRQRHADLDLPNMAFPQPVFGNCSRANLNPQYWRSLPRAMVTTDAWRIGVMQRLYLSNQFWVFPACWDTPPVGTNGDCFASITPFCLATVGTSWSDLPYLRAALNAYRSMSPATRREMLRRGLLAPTLQTLFRRSLKSVTNDIDYLTAAAHPTAFPPNGIDLERLRKLAAALTPETIPPIAIVTTMMAPPTDNPDLPETTYATPIASAFVLRSKEERRQLILRVQGGEEYRFACVHGSGVTIEASGNLATVTVCRSALAPNRRADIAVFARNSKSDWGAPSFVSIAILDDSSSYRDPIIFP